MRIRFETYQIVNPGDIIIRSTDLQNDWNSLRVGLVRDRGIITSAYLCFKNLGSLTPEFAFLLLHSYDLQKFFYGLGSGLRRNLSFGDFKRFLISRSITGRTGRHRAFRRLRDRTRIERAIRAKKKLIALLHEQKHIIIHHAVTRGLDAIVLKPSGIPWLGEVPKHWEVLPLRRITLRRCDGPFGSGLSSRHYTDSGIRVVRLQNIGHGEFRNGTSAFISAAHYATLGDHGVLHNDVLIAGLGDERHPAGRACVAPTDIEPAMVKADCFRFRLNQERAFPAFVAQHLTATARTASAILSTGSTSA